MLEESYNAAIRNANASTGDIIDADPRNTWPTGKSELVELFRRLDIGDEYFWDPERIVPFEHWVGHIPTVFWLMKVIRPRCYVELGTHRGNSYCAMCQAVETLHLDAAGYAVDTWQGDIHMGFEERIFDEFQGYHDDRYGRFSTLLSMTFDEATSFFSENKIDLLHIDGTHTYEAVRHDFENWLPKLSKRAVVLFHDTNVRRDNFGVWRLWEELERNYPAFTFLHSYGLGILGVGAEQPAPLRTLFGMVSDPKATACVRTLFALRGNTLVERLRSSQAQAFYQVDRKKAEQQLADERGKNDALQQALAEAERTRQEALEHAEALNGQIKHLTERNKVLDRILASRSWAITRLLRFGGRAIRGEWHLVRVGMRSALIPIIRQTEQSFQPVVPPSSRLARPASRTDAEPKQATAGSPSQPNNVHDRAYEYIPLRVFSVRLESGGDSQSVVNARV